MSDEAEHRNCASSIARLDERLKSQDRLREASEQAQTEALRIASNELHRRLEILNGEAQRIAQDRIDMVRRDVFDVQAALIEKRISILEGNYREQQGRLWLIFTACAGIAAGMGAAIAKLL